jgi:ankyrin repeat protein
MSESFRPVRALPASPSLEQQKKQARELLEAFRAGDPAALDRACRAHPRFNERRADFALSDAQLVLAREHGFASWPKLKASIEGVVHPGARQPYVADMAFYEARAAGLVEMHKGALPNALAQIRAWHPAFARASDEALAAARFTLDDARLVYARQNGAAGWEGLSAIVAELRQPGGDRHAFARAFAAIEQRATQRLAELLARHPELAAQQGTNGNTLLNLAVAIEREDGPLVRTLLAAGSDPGYPNDRGWTPLHQAAGADHVPLVELLVAAGAPITLSAHGDGGTPLAVALWWGAQHAAAALAEAGVVPDNLRVNAGLDRTERLARFFAADGRLTADAGEGRGFYRPHSGFPAWTPSDGSQEILDEALCWAARNDAVAALMLLAGRGANLQVAPYRGTPLMFAVAWHKPAAARWLLEHGADPNCFTAFHGQERGRVTALHLAAQTDDPELVQCLLDHGADPAIRDENYDGDPAGWARYKGCLRTLALLQS